MLRKRSRDDVITNINKNRPLFYKKKGKVKTLLEKADKLLVFTFLAIWLKELLFLALLHGKNSATLNIVKMYFSPPPALSHALFVVTIISFGFLFKNRGKAIFYAIINFLCSMLIMADLLYFRAYGAFLSVNFIKNPGNFNPLNRNLLNFHIIDLLFFIDIVVVLFIIFKNKYFYEKAKRSIVAFLLTFVLSIAYIAFDHYWIDVKDATKGTMMFFRTAWAPFQTMSNLSPLGYHVNDIIDQLGEGKNVKLSENDKKEIEQWFKDKEENLPDNDLKGVFKGKNVIFVQVESLEQFVINEKVNGQEITPNLNRMLSNSLYFPNVYEQVNNGTSSDCDFMANTSVYPVRKGSTFLRYPGNEYNSMAKLMQSIGYEAISTHPENGGNWNWIHNHKALGFNKSYDVKDYVLDDFVGPGLSDGSFFRQLVDKLKGEKKPFFAHAVTLSSHGPFEVPQDKRALNLDKEFDESILGAYFQSVNYVDRQIGNLVSMLRQKGMLENTVLVIYGDHTGVHKFYQDRLNGLKVENQKWLQKDMRVPFIIYNEGFQGKEIDTIGGQMDMMPTSAYVMGVPEDSFKNTAMGKILVKTNRNFTVLNYGDIVGQPNSDKEKENAIKGISIADKIVQGNYFKLK